MTWPAPSGRALLWLHLGYALPLVALAVWFGLIDRPPFGASRCSNCGVEGYVIAAHVIAAVWLCAVIACVAAARRQLREGIGAPGRVTVFALAAVALFAFTSLIWHSLFDLPGFGALIAAIVAFPVAAIWWTLAGVAWWRRAADDGPELQRRYGRALAAAWLSLALLLPGMFAWVWADRVQWFVF